MVLVVLLSEDEIMAYFLKKTKLKNRTYLAIYESFYSHEKKGTAHKCYKSLGSVETLTAGGMADPVAFFQSEVDSLNQAKKAGGTPKISAVSPLIYMEYFPLKSIMEKLKVKRYIDLFKLTSDSQFDLYELLSSLVYARSVNPCSKLRTFHEVLPSLFHPCNYSYDQLLDGLSFLGANYEKIVELFASQTNTVYSISTDKTYFDCTNFFFEIDREDGFRMKGPSKENRKDPIVGLGLLLDSNLVPVGMKMYPGNESEKPVLRKVVSQYMWLTKGSTARRTSLSQKRPGMATCSQNRSKCSLRKKKYGSCWIRDSRKPGIKRGNCCTVISPVSTNFPMISCTKGR